MKIKRPESPLQASTDPLDPQSDVSKLARGDFADALSQLESLIDNPPSSDTTVSGPHEATRAALLEIANSANLSDADQATKAVRQSARFMIRSRLAEKYRDSAQGRNLIEGLSSYVSYDPLMKPKMLSILKRIKSE